MIKQIMNGFSKFFKKDRIIILVAFLILALALYYYNGSKNTIIDKFSNSDYSTISPASSYQSQPQMTQPQMQQPQPQMQQPQMQQPQPQMQQPQPQMQQPQAPVSTMNNNTATPSDLLPIDNNSQWATLNPVQSSDSIMTPDLLVAGYNIGIDTIGQSLRNPNLQLRSDPIIQKMDVGPWNMSTIEPDQGRVPLEMGDTR